MKTVSPWRRVGRLVIVALAWACALPALQPARSADFLDPEDAFKFSAAVDHGGKTVEARFSIADGYYLYQERFGFIVMSDGVQLGTPQYPPGKIKLDKTFNRELVTYRGDVVVRLPVQAGNGPFTLTARLQGCADRGVCYPPEARTARLLLSTASQALDSPDPNATSIGSSPATASDPGRIETALKSGSLLVVLPIFLVLGLLLSCTPCVLPMLPILASIIVRQSAPNGDGGNGGLTGSRGFVLALAYSLGMTIVYTALGVAAGLAGEGLQRQRCSNPGCSRCLLPCSSHWRFRCLTSTTCNCLPHGRHTSRGPLGAGAAAGSPACSGWGQSAP